MRENERVRTRKRFGFDVDTHPSSHPLHAPTLTHARAGIRVCIAERTTAASQRQRTIAIVIGFGDRRSWASCVRYVFGVCVCVGMVGNTHAHPHKKNTPMSTICVPRVIGSKCEHTNAV